MANHPINLGLRFILEMSALVSMGMWGWREHAGFERFLWAIGLPVLAAAIWGTLRVPGDPGKAPIAVRGFLRLLIEIIFFITAVWALYDTGLTRASLILAIIILIHYAVSYDRIRWLLKQ